MTIFTNKHGWLAVVLATAVMLAGVVSAQQSGKKLYRWTDADGKVHYSDALPPEVVDRARQELSEKTGMVRNEVSQQLSPEERAAEEKRQAEEKRLADEMAQMKKSQNAMLSAFQTEDDLRNAYTKRRVLIEDSITSLEASSRSQRDSLTQQLQIAGDFELSGKPVPVKYTQTIELMRSEAIKQEEFLVRRQAELVALDQEMQQMLQLFRERSAAQSG